MIYIVSSSLYIYWNNIFALVLVKYLLSPPEVIFDPPQLLQSCSVNISPGRPPLEWRQHFTITPPSLAIICLTPLPSPFWSWRTLWTAPQPFNIPPAAQSMHFCKSSNGSEQRFVNVFRLGSPFNFAWMN